jgi:hypothetical protein
VGTAFWYSLGERMKAHIIISALILAVLSWGVSEYVNVTRAAVRERARQAVDDCFEWHVANRIPAQECVDMASAIGN